MENLVGDTTGLIHLIASGLALFFGTLVLVSKKGTKRHISAGYAYVVSMGILLGTAFLIYRLFNGWGIFHYAALFSLGTIVLGMIPIWRKKPVNAWRMQHFAFMYWSVIGLYAAFAAETLTRIPKAPFFGMVGVATGVITITGRIVFERNKAKWAKVFEIDKSN
ncbi:MAG: FtsH-binding integral membrane protein [Flavobacteriales bacterium]|jgi:FtsH-binding integral membrane protein